MKQELLQQVKELLLEKTLEMGTTTCDCGNNLVRDVLSAQYGDYCDNETCELVNPRKIKFKMNYPDIFNTFFIPNFSFPLEYEAPKGYCKFCSKKLVHDVLSAKYGDYCGNENCPGLWANFTLHG